MPDKKYLDRSGNEYEKRGGDWIPTGKTDWSLLKQSGNTGDEATDQWGRPIRTSSGEKLYRRSGESSGTGGGGGPGLDLSGDIATVILSVLTVIVVTVFIWTIKFWFVLLREIHRFLYARIGNVAFLLEGIVYCILGLILFVCTVPQKLDTKIMFFI